MALLIKPGVEFGEVLAPAGARILDVLKRLAPKYQFNLVITSARDGVHSGPSDPHHSGEAFDLRTHTLTDTQIQLLLLDLREALYREPRLFYAFYEAAGTANAHIHCQRRAGKIYTVYDYLSDA